MQPVLLSHTTINSGSPTWYPEASIEPFADLRPQGVAPFHALATSQTRAPIQQGSKNFASNSEQISEEEEIRRAIEASLRDVPPTQRRCSLEDLEQAIKLSLATVPSRRTSVDELKAAVEASLADTRRTSVDEIAAGISLSLDEKHQNRSASAEAQGLHGHTITQQHGARPLPSIIRSDASDSDIRRRLEGKLKPQDFFKMFLFLGKGKLKPQDFFKKFYFYFWEGEAQTTGLHQLAKGGDHDEEEGSDGAAQDSREAYQQSWR
jgi:hypothetical protein